MAMDGIIMKGVGGLYSVMGPEGIFQCKARGLFRKDNIKPLVGDHVHFEITSLEDREGYILKIHARKTELIRPEVANVDQVIITMAAVTPPPNFILLDKLIILAMNSGLDPVICFNKIELDEEETIDRVATLYAEAGHKVVLTSVKKSFGLDTLRNLMQGHVNVFAGPSGVGKSSLINAIMPGMSLKTGDVSEKIKRGRHTTRHSELFSLEDGGYVLDTPGFTSLDLSMVDKGSLRDFYREFHAAGDCRFRDCMHMEEPGCAVKEAVNEGKISAMRYDSYRYLYEEINQRKERY